MYAFAIDDTTLPGDFCYQYVALEIYYLSCIMSGIVQHICNKKRSTVKYWVKPDWSTERQRKQSATSTLHASLLETLSILWAPHPHYSSCVSIYLPWVGQKAIWSTRPAECGPHSPNQGLTPLMVSEQQHKQGSHQQFILHDAGAPSLWLSLTPLRISVAVVTILCPWWGALLYGICELTKIQSMNERTSYLRRTVVQGEKGEDLIW